MDRSTVLLLIALGLAGYGVYTALYIPAMLVGPSTPVLLVAFILQAVFAIAAAVGVWRGQRWTSGVLILLGATIAATQLVEAFVLGIVAYLYALLVAVLAIVVTLLLAVYVSRNAVPGPSPTQSTRQASHMIF